MGYSPEFQMIYCQQHSLVEVMCGSCGWRWEHWESEKLWQAFAAGFEAGASAVTRYAMGARLLGHRKDNTNEALW
jgi:hypothetical protein